MYDDSRFNRRVKEAETALKKAFGGKPADLRQALARAGRRLPIRARKAGAEILAAQDLAGHPKLQQQLDAKKLDRAFDRLMEGIQSVDVKDLRSRRLIGGLASLAFNLLLLAALVIAFARWRGLI
ncbi:hypothetical protein [Pseudooceanicola onchidii]|uniref:hypothetical protein n=1 Tax=Pseudooceanicola onchidii TaxID=2562279 RepID=UPI0010AAD71E|nr:hypothetical protein [Pseudooceanicola onchidii]